MASITEDGLMLKTHSDNIKRYNSLSTTREDTKSTTLEGADYFDQPFVLSDEDEQIDDKHNGDINSSGTTKDVLMSVDFENASGMLAYDKSTQRVIESVTPSTAPNKQSLKCLIARMKRNAAVVDVAQYVSRMPSFPDEVSDERKSDVTMNRLRSAQHVSRNVSMDAVGMSLTMSDVALTPISRDIMPRLRSKNNALPILQSSYSDVVVALEEKRRMTDVNNKTETAVHNTSSVTASRGIITANGRTYKSDGNDSTITDELIDVVKQTTGYACESRSNVDTIPTNIFQHPIPIKAGDVLPHIKVILNGISLDIHDYFTCRRGIIFGLPGVFTPKWMQSHVAGFFADQELLMEYVDYMGCIVVNDPYVISAWSKLNSFHPLSAFICDPECRLTKKLGMQIDYKNRGMGDRCEKFVMIIGTEAKIMWFTTDEDKVNSRTVMEQLRRIYDKDICTYEENGQNWSFVDLPNRKSQSPILICDQHIDGHESSTGIKMPCSLAFRYNLPAPDIYCIRNWGGNLKLMSGSAKQPLGIVIYEKVEYVVSHIELHSPSEHAFEYAEDRRFIEIIFIHKPRITVDTADSVYKENGPGIIAVSVTYDPAVDETLNPFIRSLLDILNTSMSGFEDQTFCSILSNDLESTLNLGEAFFSWGDEDAIPERVDMTLSILESTIPIDEMETPQFYRYNGSSTVPPCEENVTWFVKREAEPAALSQLESLAKLVTPVNSQGNNRVLQNVPPNNCFEGVISIVRGLRTR